MFGLVLTPLFSTTLSRTWEEVRQGFRGTIYAWKEWKLDSMFQMANVARTFAQSSPSSGT